MSKVKLIYIKKNSTGVVTSRRECHIISSIIRRQGVRTVDSGEIVVSGSVNIQEGDDVSYIQDVADTKYLRGIWNFQNSARDEAGYKLWDDESNSSYAFENIAGSISSGFWNVQGKDRKFVESWVLKLTGSSTKVKIDNVVLPQQTGNNVIDLTNQFDIFMWFKRHDNSDGAETCLFSKYDNGGSGNGLEIWVVKPDGSGDDGYIKVKARNNGTDTNITYSNPASSPVHASFGHGSRYALVRVMRGQDDKIKVYVNNTLVKEQSYSSSMNNTTAMFIGSDYNGGNNARVQIGQLRIYCGGVVSDDDATSIYTAKPQPFTAKLNGTVWKVTDKSDKKKLDVFSSSKLLLNTFVDSSERSSGSGNPLEGIWFPSAQSWEKSTRSGNVLTSSTAYKITHDLVRSADDEYRIVKEDTLSGTDATDGSRNVEKFVAYGSLTSLIKTLNLLEENTTRFFTFPTKVMLLEKAKTHTVYYTNFVHTERGIQIRDEREDDIVQANSIVVRGSTIPQRITQAGSTGSTTQTLTYNPIGTVKVTSDGTVLTQVPEYTTNGANTTLGTNEFYVNVESKQVKLNSAPSSAITMEYDYETSTNIKRIVDTNSIKENGIKTAVYTVPQLKSQRNLNHLATAIKSKLKDTNKHYTLIANSMLNFVRENQGIYIGNPQKGYNYTAKDIQSPDGTTITGGLVTDNKKEILGIEWHYPRNETVLYVGEYAYNSFDIRKMFSESLQGVNNTVMKNLSQ